MEKLNFLTFKAKVIILAVLAAVFANFSKKTEKKMRKTINDAWKEFSLKCVRNSWKDLLEANMHIFCKIPEFRNALIRSQLSNYYVLRMLRDLYTSNKQENIIGKDEIEAIATCRKFDDVDFSALYPFRKVLLKSDIDNKKEIVKIFYKNSGCAESSEELCTILLHLFLGDQDFICWLAMLEEKPFFGKYLVKNIITSGDYSGENKKLVCDLIAEKGLKDMGLVELGYTKALLDIRPLLTRKSDIDIWECCLIKEVTPWMAVKEIQKYGIHGVEGLKELLKKGNTDLIAAFNYHINTQKKANT
jgi:hypothetical protein